MNPFFLSVSLADSILSSIADMVVSFLPMVPHGVGVFLAQILPRAIAHPSFMVLACALIASCMDKPLSIQKAMQARNITASAEETPRLLARASIFSCAVLMVVSFLPR